jgi:hypothetical protein
MNFKTKFNVDDTVYYIDNNQIKYTQIYRTQVEYYQVDKDKYATDIKYMVNGNFRHEYTLFATKEEAGLAWMTSQGLMIDSKLKEVDYD